MVDSNACCYVVSDIVVSFSYRRSPSCKLQVFHLQRAVIEIPSALLLRAMKLLVISNLRTCERRKSQSVVNAADWCTRAYVYVSSTSEPTMGREWGEGGMCTSKSQRSRHKIAIWKQTAGRKFDLEWIHCCSLAHSNQRSSLQSHALVMSLPPKCITHVHHPLAV